VVNPTALGVFVLMGVLIAQWYGVLIAWGCAGLDALIRWYFSRRDQTR
jgi:hypothetical protein